VTNYHFNYKETLEIDFLNLKCIFSVKISKVGQGFLVIAFTTQLTIRPFLWENHEILCTRKMFWHRVKWSLKRRYSYNSSFITFSGIFKGSFLVQQLTENQEAEWVLVPGIGTYSPSQT